MNKKILMILSLVVSISLISLSTACDASMQSPWNYKNTPHGEVIPALYTWQSATLECTVVTTEYYPAPGEFVGGVLCSPERISGEPQSNYWNTAKGQRTLRWLASARAALQDN